MPAKKTTEQSELTFEQSLERLNEIANILENENPELDKALALYEFSVDQREDYSERNEFFCMVEELSKIVGADLHS